MENTKQEKLLSKTRQITSLCGLLKLKMEASQRVDNDGIIKNVIMFYDQEQYPEEVKAEDIKPADTKVEEAKVVEVPQQSTPVV